MITTKADLADQRWLDACVAAIDDGIEAVLDIARNWTDNRNLARLHPGVSAQDYILGRVKTPLGRGVIVPLLAESNWSNVQIAAVAGVSDETVRRTRNATSTDVEVPAKTLGADGKLRPARVIKTIEAEVIEPGEDEGEMDPEDTSTHLERWTEFYVGRLSKYIAGVLNVEPPFYAPDGAMYVVRRRHALNRRLQEVLREVMG